MSDEETAEKCRQRAARYRKLSALLADKELVCWVLAQADECDKRAAELESTRNGEQ